MLLGWIIISFIAIYSVTTALSKLLSLKYVWGGVYRKGAFYLRNCLVFIGDILTYNSTLLDVMSLKTFNSH